MENGAYRAIYDFELEHSKNEKVDTLLKFILLYEHVFFLKYVSYDTKISQENPFVAKKWPFQNIASFVHGVHHTEYDMGVYKWHHVTMVTNRGNKGRFE